MNDNTDFSALDRLAKPTKKRIGREDVDAVLNGDNRADVLAFWDTVKDAEGGQPDLIVGGKERFDINGDHPNKVGLVTSAGPSTAAGNYQITGTNWYGRNGDGIKHRLGAKTFNRDDQLRAAVMIFGDRQNGAGLEALRSGDFEKAREIAKLDWTSTPGSTIGGGGQKSHDWWTKQFEKNRLARKNGYNQLDALSGGSQDTAQLDNLATAPDFSALDTLAQNESIDQPVGEGATVSTNLATGEIVLKNGALPSSAKPTMPAPKLGVPINPASNSVQPPVLDNIVLTPKNPTNPNNALPIPQTLDIAAPRVNTANPFLKFLDQYNTALSSDDEQKFQQWAASKYGSSDQINGELGNYDLRGAWQELQSGKSKFTDNGHLPDKFKKPNHITFSDESQYANGDAGKWQRIGGKWQFTPSKQTLELYGADGLKNYFSEREKDANLNLSVAPSQSVQPAITAQTAQKAVKTPVAVETPAAALGNDYSAAQDATPEQLAAAANQFPADDVSQFQPAPPDKFIEPNIAERAVNQNLKDVAGKKFFAQPDSVEAKNNAEILSKGGQGTYTVDLSRKPSGISASDYLNREALKRVAPEFNLTDAEIDDFIKSVPQTTAYDKLTDAEIKKETAVPVSVSNGTINSILQRRSGSEINNDLLNDELRTKVGLQENTLRGGLEKNQSNNAIIRDEEQARERVRNSALTAGLNGDGSLSFTDTNNWKLAIQKFLSGENSGTEDERRAVVDDAVNEQIKTAGSARRVEALQKEYDDLDGLQKTVAHVGDFASTVARFPASFAYTGAWLEDTAGYIREKTGLPTITATDVLNSVDWLYAKSFGLQAQPQEQGKLPTLLAEAVEKALPDDPRTANSLNGKLARAIGGAVPFLVGATLTGGSSAAVALLGIGSTSGDLYKQAKNAGLSREKQLLAGLAGVPIGASELAGVKFAKLGELISQRSGGVFLKSFTHWLYETGKEATEETVQEFFQNAASAATISALKHNGLTKEDVAQAVGGSIGDAFTAGIVGALFGGGVPLATKVSTFGARANVGENISDAIKQPSNEIVQQPSAVGENLIRKSDSLSNEKTQPINPLADNPTLAAMKAKLENNENKTAPEQIAPSVESADVVSANAAAEPVAEKVDEQVNGQKVKIKPKLEGKAFEDFFGKKNEPIIDTAPEKAQDVKSDERTATTTANEIEPLQKSRQPTGATVDGKRTSVKIPDSSESYEAKYAVREIGDVIPSHNPFNFQPNADYYHVNDRRYDQEKQYQTQVETRSKGENFDPSRLLNNAPTVEVGTPVIDADGNVLGGNSRSMMLHRVYADENSTAADNYRKLLTEDAAVYGLNPADIAKFKNPVLVREVSDADISAQHAITELNKTSTTDLTANERSVAEASKISDSAVDYVTEQIERAGTDATLNDALNLSGEKIINKLIEDGVFSGGKRNTLMRDGKITADGKTRIERLLTGRVFEDVEQLENAPAYLKKNLERVIAPVTKTQIDADWNILPEVREAIDLLTEYNGKGNGLSLSDYAKQPSMFRGGFSDKAISVAEALKQSPNKVSQIFKGYAREFQDAKDGSALFGAMSPEQAFTELFSENNLRKIADERTPQNVALQDELKNNPDKSSLLPDVEAVRDGSSVRLSLEAGEIARFVESQTTGQDLEEIPTIEGLTLDAKSAGGDQVKAFTDQLETIANTVEENGGDRSTLDNLSREITEAAKEDGTVTLHVFDSAEEHENTHAATIVGSRNEQNLAKRHNEMFGDVGNIAKNENFGKFKQALESRENRGLSDAHAALEALAYLPNDYAKFGLSQAEAVDTLATILEEYEKANPNGLKAFTPSKTASLYKIIQDISNEKTNRESDSNGQSNQSGGTVEGERQTRPGEVARESEKDNEARTVPDVERGQQETDRVTKTGGEKQSKSPESLKNANIPVASRTYESATNADQQKYADKQLDKGADEALKVFNQAIADDNPNSGGTTMLGINLMDHFAKNGDLDSMNAVADKLVPKLTEYGQAIQAMATLSAFNPDTLPSYAAKVKKQFLDKPLTDAEFERAKTVAQNLSETAQADAIAEKMIQDATAARDAFKAERDALEAAKRIADGRGEKLKIKLDDAAKVIRNLKAQVKRLADAKPKAGRVTTQSKLLTELESKEADLLSRLKSKFGDMSLRMTGGKALLAPNGKPSKLTPRQQADVKTPEFKRFFKDSKVVDNETGEPKILFHGTRNNSDFEVFDTKGSVFQLGAHFGTAEQTAKATLPLKDSPKGSSSRTIPVYLSIENPLRLEDTGGWGDKTVNQLQKKGVISKAEEKRLLKQSADLTILDDDANRAYTIAVQNAIKKAGYDGVVYDNYYEGDGDSYIVFEPSQIKSAIGNNGEFSSDNDSILRKTGDTVLDQDFTDYATLKLLRGLKENISVKAFKEQMNDVAGGALSNEQLADLHAAAVENIRVARPVTDEQKAAQKVRSKHYKAADEHSSNADNEQTKFIEDAAKMVRDYQVKKDADALASAVPDGLGKYTTELFRQGIVGDHTEQSIFSALAQKSGTPAEVKAKLEAAFPELSPADIKRAMADGNALNEQTRKSVMYRSIRAKNDFDLSVADIERYQDEKKLNDREKNQATRAAQSFYDSLIKSSAQVAADTAISYSKANLLVAPTTHLQNMVSTGLNIGIDEFSRPVGALADIAVSRVTGERAFQGLSPRAVANSLKNVAITDETLKNLDRESGIKAAIQILKYGATDEELKNLQFSESNAKEKFGTVGAVADAYINTVFRALAAEDAIFKVIAFRRSLEELAKIQAINERKANPSINLNERRLEILRHPSNVMQIQATEYAKEATFNNENVLSGIISRGKQGLKNLDSGYESADIAGKAIGFAVDIALPFDKTPTNVLLRVLDYSPVGLARSGLALRRTLKNTPGAKQMKSFNQAYRSAVATDLQTEEFNALSPTEQRTRIAEEVDKLWKGKQQREFSKLFGRGTSGTFVLLPLGYILARTGLLAGSMGGDDKDEKSEFFDRLGKGVENRSVLIPNIGRFVLPQTPQLTALTLGATLYEQEALTPKGKLNPVTAMVNGLSETTFSALGEQPLARTFSDFYGREQSLGARAGNIATRFIPASALVGRIGDVMDDKARRSSETPEAKKKGGAEKQISGFKNAFLSKVPLARTYADESTFGANAANKQRGGYFRRVARQIDILNTRQPTAYKVAKK